MQAARRSCCQLAKGFAGWTAPRYFLRAGTSDGLLLHPSQHSSWTPLWKITAPFSQGQQEKDHSLPNPKWSPEMMEQYEKLMAMTKDGKWQKMPLYESFADFIPELLAHELATKKPEGTKYLILDKESFGFEYSHFYNQLEERLMCLFQPSPYLEGPTGFVHSGAIISVLDTAFGCTAIFAGTSMVTASISINYKNPIPLETVVLVETKVEKKEGRKMFMSGSVQSVDRQVLHMEGTALFVKLGSHTNKPLSKDPTKSSKSAKSGKEAAWIP